MSKDNRKDLDSALADPAVQDKMKSIIDANPEVKAKVAKLKGEKMADSIVSEKEAQERRAKMKLVKAALDKLTDNLRELLAKAQPPRPVKGQTDYESPQREPMPAASARDTTPAKPEWEQGSGSTSTDPVESLRQQYALSNRDRLAAEKAEDAWHKFSTTSEEAKRFNTWFKAHSGSMRNRLSLEKDPQKQKEMYDAAVAAQKQKYHDMVVSAWEKRGDKRAADSAKRKDARDAAEQKRYEASVADQIRMYGAPQHEVDLTESNKRRVEDVATIVNRVAASSDRAIDKSAVARQLVRGMLADRGNYFDNGKFKIAFKWDALGGKEFRPGDALVGDRNKESGVHENMHDRVVHYAMTGNVPREVALSPEWKNSGYQHAGHTGHEPSTANQIHSFEFEKPTVDMGTSSRSTGSAGNEVLGATLPANYRPPRKF